jgi:hypothetical protein
MSSLVILILVCCNPRVPKPRRQGGLLRRRGLGPLLPASSLSRRHQRSVGQSPDGDGGGGALSARGAVVFGSGGGVCCWEVMRRVAGFRRQARNGDDDSGWPPRDGGNPAARQRRAYSGLDGPGRASALAPAAG